MPTSSTVFLVFTGVLAFAVLLQTLILLAFLIAAKAAQKKAMEQFESLREDLRPLLDGATQMMETMQDMAPRVRAITVNVHTASEKLREQVNHIDSVVVDVTGKTRTQVSRIDQMISDTLDAIAHGTRVVQDNVMAPLRQIGGWMSTIRAAMDIMRGSGERRTERRYRRSDED
ncbi:MAG: hypothetical protein WA708_05255 [Acidobacteriaceae bacterium]